MIEPVDIRLAHRGLWPRGPGPPAMSPSFSPRILSRTRNSHRYDIRTRRRPRTGAKTLHLRKRLDGVGQARASVKVEGVGLPDPAVRAPSSTRYRTRPPTRIGMVKLPKGLNMASSRWPTLRAAVTASLTRPTLSIIKQTRRHGFPPHTDLAQELRWMIDAVNSLSQREWARRVARRFERLSARRPAAGTRSRRPSPPRPEPCRDFRSCVFADVGRRRASTRRARRRPPRCRLIRNGQASVQQGLVAARWMNAERTLQTSGSACCAHKVVQAYQRRSGPGCRIWVDGAVHDYSGLFLPGRPFVLQAAHRSRWERSCE